MLFQNYPNPFNPDTRIDFSMPGEGSVTLSIYNIKGELVTTLLDGTLPAGRHAVDWHSVDGRGDPVASGVYFYRVKTQYGSATKNMILIR